MEEMLMSIISWIVNRYPVAVTILAFLGMLRMMIKPIMTAIGEIVLITPTDKDDKLLEKVKQSKVFKALLYILDWTTSLKIKAQKEGENKK